MNPLTGIYAGATSLRNTLFDRGVLRERRLTKPVISVGNISVGGSGKTPFVIAMGELLKQRGLSVDVLSRGYGRRRSGVGVVDPSGSSIDFGDEPLLIARRLDVPVVVGVSRYQAGLLAESTFPSSLHILDDGFQHRSLGRAFDIVLLSADDFSGRLLPSGRLREPLSSLHRADAVVLPEEITVKHPALEGKTVWRMRRVMEPLDAPQNPVVFCGIARPGQFFTQVRRSGVTPAAEISYADHHRYSRGDIQSLLEVHRSRKAGGFLTTEKDLVNLGDFREALQPLSIASLRVVLDRPADAVDTILQRISDRMPRS